ncbi:diacylglyceryl transferase [Flavobacteriaceae bacterium]|jgi:sterol desaturase/sphingolipid hydroxylase (fatty acid hydroxylase superfamily)|nr:diacylglyceryl transferase [Flavobacteriaceae bacterium]
MFKRLKKKWGIVSDIQLTVIFIVFAITGSASAKLALPLLEFLGIQGADFEEIPLGVLIYFLLRILIIFPIYQVLLILVATVFFQFKFFWEFEKKILKRVGLNFLLRRKDKD